MADPLLTFLYGQSVPYCNHNIDKHFEGYCTLQYMASGSVALSVDGDRRLLDGRWFWSCYPGPRLAFCPAIERSTWNHHYLAFSGELVKSWQADGLFPVPPQRPPYGADYSSRFDEVLALSRREDRWGVRRAINALEGILIELAEWRNRVSDDAVITRAITLLHESADEQLMCGELAGHVGVSERTLRRRFVVATGHSPRQYLIQQRTAAARRLLAETDMPIKQIAEELGYKDVFFFTRQFTRATGVPPGEYRRSCAG
jgi:AraC-like DNA-binding protein